MTKVNKYLGNIRRNREAVTLQISARDAGKLEC